ANDFAYPTACALRFKFAARGDRPGIELFWYDGGMKPRLPEVVEAHDVTLDREGILFVGDEGAILAGFRGDGPRLFGKGAPRPLTEAAGSGEAAEGRAASWLRAFQGGEASPGSFLNAGPITDTVNLGTVALRAGTRVEFDAAAMRITNVESANRFLTRDYRKGWEL
ncbi:MAG: gfo/Idh/MocA family oxidoreductase, partial [Verrucomicrobiae bacterium]|nr:gfo/Idh/MocA family oxidoreductase [Verrucomicrobiae bacterium]